MVERKKRRERARVMKKWRERRDGERMIKRRKEGVKEGRMREIYRVQKVKDQNRKTGRTGGNRSRERQE